MFKLFFIYREIRKSPLKRTSFSPNCPLLSLSRNDTMKYICDTMGISLELIQSFEEISWLDILLRRIRIISIPSKKFVKSNSDKWKRRALKYFNLSIRNELSIHWLHTSLFLDYGHKVLYTNANHVAEIYSVHLPDFNILQISDENCKCNTKLIYNLALSLKEEQIDRQRGITVFANIISPWILRSYRIIHPNRRIVLRFHDTIKGQVAGNLFSYDQIRSLAKTLKQEGTVDEIESYCRKDALDLACIYRPNGVNPEFLQKYDKPYRELLYCFIGSQDKNKKSARTEALTTLQNEIFRIYKNSANHCISKIADSSDFWLSYTDFIRIYVLSEVYIDLVRVNQYEGFSFRIPEALWLNRKIISNRISLQDEPFYSTDRVFLIGIDPIDKLQTFLEKDLSSLPNDILRLYNSRLWWQDDIPAQCDMSDTIREN